MRPISHGPSSTSTPHMASSLGMKDSVIVDLRGGLENADDQAHDQRDEQQRPAIANAIFIAW